MHNISISISSKYTTTVLKIFCLSFAISISFSCSALSTLASSHFLALLSLSLLCTGIFQKHNSYSFLSFSPPFGLSPLSLCHIPPLLIYLSAPISYPLFLLLALFLSSSLSLFPPSLSLSLPHLSLSL